MTEAVATVDLSTVSDADLIAEIKERRWESDAIADFYDDIGDAAIEELAEEHAVIEFGELEELNDWFWRAPEKAPAVTRSWLQRLTGRV